VVLTIDGATLYGYHPGNNSTRRELADWTVSGVDIKKVSYSQRGQELKDTAEFTIDNFNGRYTGDIRHRDRLEFYINPAGEETADVAYEDGQYGSSIYGGQSFSEGFGGVATHRWTGRVRSPLSITNKGGPNYEISFGAEDFVYGVLGDRTHSAAYIDRKISGTEDAILNRALRLKAPEVDRFYIEDVDVSTDYKPQSEFLIDILKEMIRRGDAYAHAERGALIFRKPTDVSPKLHIDRASGHWYSPKYTTDDDELVNDVIAFGGTSPKLETKAGKSAEATVTETNRLTTELATRKSSLHAIDVWVDPDYVNSGEDVVIRLQHPNADGTAPVAPDDTQSDIVNESLDTENDEIDPKTFNRVVLPDHDIPEAHPWLIVQSSGTEGVRVGEASDGGPAFEAFFPFPVSAPHDDPESVSKYGRVEDTIEDNALMTATDAHDAARGAVRHSSEPTGALQFEARSAECHELELGDTFTVADPMLGIGADGGETFLIVEKAEEYNGIELTTTFTAHRLAGL